MKKYIREHPGEELEADFLDIQGTMAGGKKGVGGWTWQRNKRFIDDALARGDDIRMVTNPDQPLYLGGNTYQRELKYLRDKGYSWRRNGDHWTLFRTRPGFGQETGTQGALNAIRAQYDAEATALGDIEEQLRGSRSGRS